MRSGWLCPSRWRRCASPLGRLFWSTTLRQAYWPTSATNALVLTRIRTVVDAARSAGRPCRVCTARVCTAVAHGRRSLANCDGLAAGRACRGCAVLVPSRRGPTPSWLTSLKPTAGEPVFDKLGMSAFVGTPLEVVLRDPGGDHAHPRGCRSRDRDHRGDGKGMPPISAFFPLWSRTPAAWLNQRLRNVRWPVSITRSCRTGRPLPRSWRLCPPRRRRAAAPQPALSCRLERAVASSSASNTR